MEGRDLPRIGVDKVYFYTSTMKDEMAVVSHILSSTIVVLAFFSANLHIKQLCRIIWDIMEDILERP